MKSSGLIQTNGTALPQEIIDQINQVDFWNSIPLWIITLIGSIVIIVLSFVMLLSVYGRMFRLYMVSLLIQQLYREILAVADENGGTLPNRAMFYCDEFGTLPPIQSAEMMYSASRSRRLSIVSIIQSYQQLEKNYGKEGAAIIQDNCQLTIAGGFAPSSETADIISRRLVRGQL